VAQISKEPQKPVQEFNIAIAGPIVSALLGVFFYGVMLLAQASSEGIAALGEWLSRINLLVAAFNLLPGFPLDGGRVLRAVWWRISGNLAHATRAASAAGKGFAVRRATGAGLCPSGRGEVACRAAGQRFTRRQCFRRGLAVLALALAGCMSVDVVHMLARGRHAPRAMRSRFVGDRAQEDPHRFLRIALHFTIEGDMPADVVERAVRLSREKYCSVWHSLRQDIDFRVTFDLVPGTGR